MNRIMNNWEILHKYIPNHASVYEYNGSTNVYSIDKLLQCQNTNLIIHWLPRVCIHKCIVCVTKLPF